MVFSPFENILVSNILEMRRFLFSKFMKNTEKPVSNQENSKNPHEVLLKLEYKPLNRFWRTLLFILLGIILLILAGFIFLLYKSQQYLKTFSDAAEISQEETLQTAKTLSEHFEQSYRNLQNLPQENTFLLLGADQVDGRQGQPELTDTLLLAQLSAQDQSLRLLSLPRDLYSDAYQTKINALYEYGKERYPDEPERFTEEVLEEMTTVPIDYSFVISIDDLEKIIDIVGGIEIDVPNAFTDKLFPRQGVDIATVHDPALLYETIEFHSGPQLMDGQHALQYMRSRHAEGDEGTDIARSNRQQLVLNSLLKKLQSELNPEVLGKLYRFYLDHYEKKITLTDLLDLALPLLIKQDQIQIPDLKTEHLSLPIYPDDPQGIIFTPDTWKNGGQWIYQVRDQQNFQEYFQKTFPRKDTLAS